MSVLRELQPSLIEELQLEKYLKNGLALQELLSEQKLFMYKISSAKLRHLVETSDIASGNRIALSLHMLSGRLNDEPRESTVILLNAEKEILSQEEMVKQLEDLDDPSEVLETPNLVVIPFDKDARSIQGVVSSQSFIYESLSDLKDWFRLQVGKS